MRERDQATQTGSAIASDPIPSAAAEATRQTGSVLTVMRRSSLRMWCFEPGAAVAATDTQSRQSIWQPAIRKLDLSGDGDEACNNNTLTFSYLDLKCASCCSSD